MSKKDREELKYLETVKNSIAGKIEGLKQEKRVIDREISVTMINLKEVNEKIDKIKCNGKITVSEHAIIRYIERVMGINIDDITDKILSEDIEDRIMEFGNGVYTVNSNEFKIKVRDGIVVTVLKE